MPRTYTDSAYAIVFRVVGWFLDVVSANYSSIAVVVVAFVGGEVDFSKELLLMMLEFADHCV